MSQITVFNQKWQRFHTMTFGQETCDDMDTHPALFYWMVA